MSSSLFKKIVEKLSAIISSDKATMPGRCHFATFREMHEICEAEIINDDFIEMLNFCAVESGLFVTRIGNGYHTLVTGVSVIWKK